MQKTSDSGVSDGGTDHTIEQIYENEIISERCNLFKIHGSQFNTCSKLIYQVLNRQFLCVIIMVFLHYIIYTK